MYDTSNEKVIKFLGYKTIVADSSEQAYLSAKEANDTVKYVQIWIPQND